MKRSKSADIIPVKRRKLITRLLLDKVDMQSASITSRERDLEREKEFGYDSLLIRPLHLPTAQELEGFFGRQGHPARGPVADFATARPKCEPRRGSQSIGGAVAARPGLIKELFAFPYSRAYIVIE